MVSTSEFGSGDTGREEKRPRSQLSFKIKYYKIISFRIISKIILNREKMVWMILKRMVCETP